MLNYSVLAQSGRVVTKPHLNNIPCSNLSHEERFTAIEGELGGLKNNVADIGSKLDKLLENLVIQGEKQADNARDSNITIWEGSSTHNTQSEAITQTDASSGPGYNSHSLSMDDFVSRNMDRDKFEHYHNGNPGFYSESSFGRGMQKPYMYTSREGLYTSKQNLDVCNSLSAIEYIDATLGLLEDKRA